MQRSLGTKQTKSGKDFYFGTLKLDDDTEKVIFFFDPDYNLLTKLHSLSQGDQIKVIGLNSQRKNYFTVKELINDGNEIF